MPVIHISHENILPESNIRGVAFSEDFTEVWVAKIQTFVPYLHLLVKLLNEDEIIKSRKFNQQKDGMSFIVRHGLLRLLLSRYTGTLPGLIDFGLGQNKKPVAVTLNGSTHFNTSQSNDLILVAFSPDEIGVDVEFVSNKFDYMDVLTYSFSPPEVAHVQKSKSSRQEFYKLWTRKEALLKATSKGLDDDLPNIPSIDGLHRVESEMLWTDKSWSVKSFNAGDEYVASFAHSGALDSRVLTCRPEDVFSER